MEQFVVWMGVVHAKDDIGSINKLFSKNGWGRLEYVREFNTLRGQGGAGGRTDVVFRWTGSQEQLAKFSTQRFALGVDAPRWLEDYLKNNADIIPRDVYMELSEKKKW